MAKHIWDFTAMTQINDDTMFLVSDGTVTRTVPGSLINLIAARIDSIIAGETTSVSVAEISDARVQANGQTATSLGNAIRWVYNALLEEEHETYTSFDGTLETGRVTVTKKGGVCYISGSVTPSGALSDWVTILDNTKVPAPQHGELIPFNVPAWGSSYTAALRGRIPASGGLQIRLGAAREYVFTLSYPID